MLKGLKVSEGGEEVGVRFGARAADGSEERVCRPAPTKAGENAARAKPFEAPFATQGKQGKHGIW
jgi:hypothetical protein